MAVESTEIALLVCLSCYHGLSLNRLPNWSWSLVPVFHLLFLIGFLGVPPAQCMDLACFADERMAICENWSTSNVGLSVAQVLIMTVCNVGLVSINANFAMIGYSARKEIVYARRGPIRWRSSRKAMRVFSISLAAMGLLFFLNFSPFLTLSQTNWCETASCVIVWIGVLVRIVTVGTATVQVGILACTLNYSQRVLPFMNTRLLLLAMLTCTVHFLLQACAFMPNVLDNEVAQVPLAWLQVLCGTTSYTLLAYLFRHAKDETTPLL
jgi:hypothetical protein